jgi:hypothetical protein
MPFRGGACIGGGGADAYGGAAGWAFGNDCGG